MGVTLRGSARCESLMMLVGWVALAACGSTGLSLDGDLGSRIGGQLGDAGVGRVDGGGDMSAAGRRAGGGGRAAPDGRAGSSGSFDGGAGRSGGSGDGGFADGGFTDGGFADGGPGRTDGGFADGGARHDASAADSGVTFDAGPVVWCEGGTHHGSLYVSTKSDLEKLRGCRSVTGDLVITASDIADLQALESLETIGGNLQVGHGWNDVAPTELSLRGLERLKSANAFTLLGTRVSSVEPLSNLETVYSLNITRADRLENLNGLGKLTWQVASIMDNPALVSLEGLRAPEEVWQVEIASNPKLASLTALRGVKRASNVMLTALPALTSLDGLQDLEQITTLGIHQLDALIDLTGLGAFGEDTLLDSNAALRSLSGRTMRGKLGSLQLVHNPLLQNLMGAFGPPETIGTSPAIALSHLPSLTSLAGLETVTTLTEIMIETCDSLVDLQGLSGLKTAGGIYIGDARSLQSLAGLDALERLDNGLFLEALPALTSLAGMPKLQQLNALVIGGSSALASMQGFPPVTKIMQVELHENLKLASLAGMEAVSEVTSLLIGGNISLVNLTGLAGLKLVSALHVVQNPQLTSLAGVGLTTADEIYIEANPSLGALTGLEMLTEVRGPLTVVSNQSLMSLRALAGLTKVGALSIQENRRLPQCEVDWLAKRLNMDSLGGANGPPGMCPP